MNTDKIKRQAKQILDNFADALASVEKNRMETKVSPTSPHSLGSVERDEFERKEENKENTKENNSEFRQAFLKNSPAHDEDFIIAERGGWI